MYSWSWNFTFPFLEFFGRFWNLSRNWHLYLLNLDMAHNVTCKNVLFCIHLCSLSISCSFSFVQIWAYLRMAPMSLAWPYKNLEEVSVKVSVQNDMATFTSLTFQWLLHIMYFLLTHMLHFLFTSLLWEALKNALQKNLEIPVNDLSQSKTPLNKVWPQWFLVKLSLSLKLGHRSVSNILDYFPFCMCTQHVHRSTELSVILSYVNRSGRQAWIHSQELNFLTVTSVLTIAWMSLLFQSYMCILKIHTQRISESNFPFHTI